MTKADSFYQDLKKALKELGIGPAYRTMIFGAVEETMARHLVNGRLSLRGWIKVTTHANVQTVRNVATGETIGEQTVVIARASVGPRLKQLLLEKAEHAEQ